MRRLALGLVLVLGLGGTFGVVGGVLGTAVTDADGRNFVYVSRQTCS
jgi:hypothetical protein